MEQQTDFFSLLSNVEPELKNIEEVKDDGRCHRDQKLSSPPGQKGDQCGQKNDDRQLSTSRTPGYQNAASGRSDEIVPNELQYGRRPSPV